jgi:hypothetical protein
MVETAGLFTLANASIRKPLIEKELQPGSIIRGLIVKIFGHVSHFHPSRLAKGSGAHDRPWLLFKTRRSRKGLQ